MDSQQAQPTESLEREVIIDPRLIGGSDAVSPDAIAAVVVDRGLLSNKHLLSSPAVKRPAKAQKAVKKQSPSVEDNAKNSIGPDPVSEPAVAQHSPEAADIRRTLDVSYQKAFVKQVKALLINTEPSSPPVNGQTSASPRTAADTDASIEPGVPFEQSRTGDQISTDGIDHDFFHRLLSSDVLNQPSPGPQPQCPAAPRLSPAQLDFPSSPTMPSYRSSLLPQEMQPPSTPTTLQPPSEYEIVRDYSTGNIFPNSYLDRIRDSVDSAFSNENWGDEHYFSGPSGFKHLEDFKPNPHHKADRQAVLQGLQLRAMAIPMGSMRTAGRASKDR